MKIVEENRGGRLCIDGVNLAKGLTISSLRVTRVLSGTLEAWERLYADDIKEIEGKKRFSFTADGIMLVVDADKDIKVNPIIPEGVENPTVIPFSKWLRDYVKKHNDENASDEEKIYSLTVEGCEIDHNGIIRALNAKVTWGKVYGSFGRLTTEKSLEISRDILGGTYNMRRNDSIYDDWTPNCCGDHGHRAYFTDGFDVVYADDGRYTINGKPPPSAKVA